MVNGLGGSYEKEINQMAIFNSVVEIYKPLIKEIPYQHFNGTSLMPLPDLIQATYILVIGSIPLSLTKFPEIFCP